MGIVCNEKILKMQELKKTIEVKNFKSCYSNKENTNINIFSETFVLFLDEYFQGF